MTTMTYNTIVFFGSNDDIQSLSQLVCDGLDFQKIVPIPTEHCDKDHSVSKDWALENWGATWSITTEMLVTSMDEFSTLKIVFETPWRTPLGVIKALYERFPRVKGIHRVTSEGGLYETVFVRRDPLRGFQKFLVDNPYGIKGSTEDTESSNFEILDEYLEEIKVDKQLRIVSEIVGVTEIRIKQRQLGELTSI